MITAPIVTPTLVTGPTVEPVILEEILPWLNQTAGVDDQVLLGNLTAAREWFEIACDRSFCQKTWDYKFPYFYATEIELPYPPLVSVTSITYLDVNEDSQTLSTDVYDVVTSRTPGVVRQAWDQVWPTVAINPEAVTIRFVSGVNAVPELVKNGIKMLTAFWYANRGDQTVTGPGQQAQVPPAVMNIVTATASYRF